MWHFYFLYFGTGKVDQSILPCGRISEEGMARGRPLMHWPTFYKQTGIWPPIAPYAAEPPLCKTKKTKMLFITKGKRKEKKRDIKDINKRKSSVNTLLHSTADTHARVRSLIKRPFIFFSFFFVLFCRRARFSSGHSLSPPLPSYFPFFSYLSACACLSTERKNNKKIS